MSTFGEGSQGGEETAVPAVGGDQQQHSMGQISRLLGRPKCFSGREKEVKKLQQQVETYEEVPLAEAEGQEIISSPFGDKWEESGELRSRLVSQVYESSHADPASLFAATPSVVATRLALVLGLTQDVEMAVADISGAFSSCGVGETFLCHTAS